MNENETAGTPAHGEGYIWDIFLSYRWDGAIQNWVNTILYPIILEHVNGFAPHVTVFKDTEQIKPGITLTPGLRKGLIRSKCLISLISPPYFVNSEWCTKEFSTLHHREKQLGFRNTNNPKGLIFPIIFTAFNSAGQPIPIIYKYPKAIDLAKEFMPLELDRGKYLRTNTAFLESNDYNDLVNKVRTWLDESVFPILDNPQIVWKPDFDTPQWLDEPYEKFVATYINEQKSIPKPQMQ